MEKCKARNEKLNENEMAKMNVPIVWQEKNWKIDKYKN